MVCWSIDVGKLREISTRNLEADVSVVKSSRSFSPKDLNVARSHGNETRQLCRFIKWLTLLFLVLDFTSISLFQPANITRDACTIKIRSTDPHLRSLSLYRSSTADRLLRLFLVVRRSLFKSNATSFCTVKKLHDVAVQRNATSIRQTSTSKRIFVYASIAEGTRCVLRNTLARLFY